jgi:glyoxylate reductase
MSQGYLLVTGDFALPAHHPSWEIVQLARPSSESQIERAIRDAAYYVLGGPEYLSRGLLAAAPRLEKVVVLGTGTPSFIDLEAAAALGIAVDNVPGVNAEAVGEFALGMMIATLASAFHSHACLLRGEWYQTPHSSLAHARVGVVGMGATAQALCRRIRALSELPIRYWSRTRRPELEAALSLEYVPLATLVASCDVVSVHVDLNPGTRALIDDRVLAHAHPGLRLLSFSNPQVIDPAALQRALRDDAIAFAFLDGFYQEWIHNPGQAGDTTGLLALPPAKLVATTHIAAQETSAIAELVREAYRKLGVHTERVAAARRSQ